MTDQATLARPMAMLLTESETALDGAALAAAVQPRLPGAEVSLIGDGSGESQMLTVDGAMFALMDIPQPAPAQEFADPLKHSYGFDDATALVATHRRHVIASPLAAAEDHAAAQRDSLVLTQIAAAIAEQVSASVSYWVSAGAVMRPAALLEYASDSNEPPLPLWIGFRFAPTQWEDGSRSLGLQTKGLRAFFEFEVVMAAKGDDPNFLASRTLGLLQYLMANGAVIKEGDTIRISQTERIRARYAGEGPARTLFLMLEQGEG